MTTNDEKKLFSLRLNDRNFSIMSKCEQVCKIELRTLAFTLFLTLHKALFIMKSKSKRELPIEVALSDMKNNEKPNVKSCIL